MLDKVSFVCENPDCRQRQSVMNSRKVQSRTVNCCKCGHPNVVFFDTDMTIIRNYPQEQHISSWFLEHNGDRQPLNEGEQTLGRMSSSHEADLEIYTEEDKSVSRIHCLLKVVKLKSGREKVIISDIRGEEKIEKMATTVNGMPLANGDLIVLQDGDKVIMGKQTLTFLLVNKEK